MLRFFRLNDPYRLLGLLVLLLFFSLPIIIYPPSLTIQELRGMLIGEAIGSGNFLYAELFDSTAPLSSVFFGVVNWLIGRSVLGRQIFSLLILFFQASFLAIILIRNKAFIDSTYLPALVFGVLCFFSFDMLSFSPELLGSTLLLIAINNLFKEIEFKIQRDEIILSLGFYLGLASLCLFSFTLFFLGSIIILLVFTRTTLRKYLLLSFGFVLPHALLICYYLFRDESESLFQNFYLANLTLSGVGLVSVQSLLILLALPAGFLVLSFFRLNNEGRFTKYQSQLTQVMLLWLVFSFIHVSLTRERSPHSFIIFIPSLAYFITQYFLLARRKVLAEYIFALFMMGIITVSTLCRLNVIKGVTYHNLFVQTVRTPVHNKKIMVLTDGLGYYKTNTLSGYFLDWPLSKIIFDEPDYYEHLILVRKMFDSELPEVIVDPHDKLQPFFKRIPDIAKKYKREAGGYTKISN